MSAFFCCFCNSRQYEDAQAEEPEKPKLIVPVPKIGVSIPYLDSFIEAQGGTETLEPLSTDAVWGQFVKPLTEESRTSLCEVLVKDRKLASRSATILIIHDPSSSFLNLVTQVRTICSTRQGSTVWLDVFSYPQYDVENIDRQKWVLAFKSMIAAMKESFFILPLSGHGQIPIFTSSWSLFSLHNAIDAKVPVHLPLAPEEKKHLVRELISDTRTKVAGFCDQIDWKSSKYSVKELDLAMKEAVDAAVINKSVQTWLKAHFASILEEELTNTPDPVEQTEEEKEACAETAAAAAAAVDVEGSSAESSPTDRHATSTDDTQHAPHAEPEVVLVSEAPAIEVSPEPQSTPAAKAAVEETAAQSDDPSAVVDAVLTEIIASMKSEGEVEVEAASGAAPASAEGTSSADAVPDSAAAASSDEVAAPAESETGVAVDDVAVAVEPETVPAAADAQDAQAVPAEAPAVVEEPVIEEPVIEYFDKNALRMALAELFMSVERFQDALPLLVTSSEEVEKRLNRVHPLTLSCLHALAECHEGLGDSATAEALFTEVYKKRSSVLGSNHVDTLASMSALAVLYRNQKKFDKALPLYEKCYTRRKQALGENHHQTISTQYNLALLYQNQKQYRLAMPLYVDCLMRRRQILGDLHPQTLMCMYNLAINYFSAGKTDMAEQLYVECLAKRRQALGDDHVDTLNTLHNLAALYQSLDMDAQAEQYYRECLERRSKTLGDDHASTVRTRKNLEQLMEKIAKLRAAAPKEAAPEEPAAAAPSAEEEPASTSNAEDAAKAT